MGGRKPVLGGFGEVWRIPSCRSIWKILAQMRSILLHYLTAVGGPRHR
ncbi:Hypothetical protein GbCGDNIH9_8658 [Granulibacter bethesdensis]|uniref:Uncharacterized protein n=1 Tax=Granulibacter bethesdensis TaxID=364410 RepID=A0AAC9KB76_9PROT|nr:Hypothetical protein GbCGDNIH9_8658 [Granulibacter bethesdensis]APH62694.1 Hypothetical protein GbCGDNIH8_8658 [Granulibacter bethesdensis]